MANKILVVGDSERIAFGAPTYSGDLENVDYALDTNNLTLARESNKADMDTGGVANRFPKEFAITVIIEYTGPPNPGESTDLYWAPSVSGTAATANPGGVTGSDGAYSGTAGSTLDESLKELQFLGSLVATADGSPVIQQQTFKATLPTQYGTLVIDNNTSTTLKDLSQETVIIFTPIEYEVQ